jgi:hypothetical protein
MDNFPEALEECNLSDLGYVGPKFTWINCRGSGEFINNNWIELSRIKGGVQCIKQWRFMCSQLKRLTISP